MMALFHLQLKYENKQNSELKLKHLTMKILCRMILKLNTIQNYKVNVISGIYGASKPNLFYKLT